MSFKRISLADYGDRKAGDGQEETASQAGLGPSLPRNYYYIVCVSHYNTYTCLHMKKWMTAFRNWFSPTKWFQEN